MIVTVVAEGMSEELQLVLVMVAVMYPSMDMVGQVEPAVQVCGTLRQAWQAAQVELTGRTPIAGVRVVQVIVRVILVPIRQGVIGIARVVVRHLLQVYGIIFHVPITIGVTVDMVLPISDIAELRPPAVPEIFRAACLSDKNSV